MLGVGVLACVADAAGVIATSECSHCMACRVCLVGLAGDEICTSSSEDLCHRSGVSKIGVKSPLQIGIEYTVTFIL